ncbi:MAG: 2-oxoacid:acceptor oxidoreductase family protein [Thermodesulfobacteriota bacterium]
MYRIRFHGRGGQGMKSASRILGTAFFLTGYEVQDAPRYGAERRGAPMSAYVRASKEVIFERGIIHQPDLVIVADESLLLLPAAGVGAGLDEHSVLLIHSNGQRAAFCEQFRNVASLLLLPTIKSTVQSGIQPLSAICAAAAAALCDLSLESLQEGVKSELAAIGRDKLAWNLEQAEETFSTIKAEGVLVRQQKGDGELKLPDWIELPFEEARLSAPVIHGSATSLKMNTGSWRSLRPQIDHDRCSRCGLCNTFCPDGVISMDNEGFPLIDYGHCKGCLICLVQCPTHAITAVSESKQSVASGEATS